MEDDVWEKRTCYERGCEQGECSENTRVEKRPVEECDDECVDGSCTEVDCIDADYEFDVDMKVCAKGFSSPTCSEIDSETINVNKGEYEVKGIVERGYPGQCQTNENFYLEINGEQGPTTVDDSDPCAMSVRIDDLGAFDFYQGNNEVFMNSASVYSIDKEANSVKLNKLCLYKLDECSVDSDCGEDICSNWEYYCKCTELWRKRTCIDVGCENGECYQDEVYEDEFYEKCNFMCWQGECIDCGWDCDTPGCDFDWNWSCDIPGCDWDTFNWNYSC